MDLKTAKLKDAAEKGKMLYCSGRMAQEDAKLLVMPYLNAINARAVEIAAKYNQRPRTVSFRAFVR